MTQSVAKNGRKMTPPAPMPVIADNIPAELWDAQIFVNWSWVWNPKKHSGAGGWDKPPKQCNGSPASSTNPDTWSTFDLAFEAHESGRFDGLGVCFDNDDGRVGLDLDHCRDADSGEVTPAAQAIIDKLKSYTEVSPSGTGIRIIVRASHEGGSKVDHNKGIEIYQGRGRYLTLTGHRLEGFPATIEERTDELAEVIAANFAPQVVKQLPPTRSTYFLPPTLEDIASALAALPPRFCDETEWWWGIGHAIHRVDSSAAGLAVWDEWSRNSPNYGEGECAKRWDRMGGMPSGVGRSAMTVNTIFKYARDNGWQRPRAAPERVPLENVVSDSGSADGRDLPVIEVGFDEMRIVDEVVTALMDRPNLYQRGGLLVEVRESPEPPPCIIRPEGGVRVVTIPKYRLREIITDSVRFVRKRDGKDGEPALKDVRCPQTAVEQVLARGFWRGFKTIEGVVSAPQFLLDGSVLGVTGYHPRSGLFFESSPGVVFPAVPDRPTKQDAERARDQLLEVVCDMPLDQISRAGWIALALTCVARHAIAGPTPLFVIDANTRGTGKSLAADAVGIIATGRELPRTTWTNDNAECRKMITAVLLAAEPITLLDNIGTVLGNPPLDALLTSATWTDRVLGVSEMTAKLPATTIWSASGNNILLAADTARRTLRIRLESLEENPEERSGFKHPNLLGWVRQHRCRLAVAAVTILRAWHVAGRPDMGLPPWGSFESWSGVIRNATVWVGLADPGASRQVLQCESDREAILLRQILQAWYEADPNSCGLTVGDAISMAEKGDGGLAAVFAELAGPNGKPNVRSVGMKFHHLRGRVCGGMYLDKRPTNRGAAWLIRFAECDAKSGETSGTKDTSDTNPGHPVGARKHTHAGAHVVGAGASVTCVPSVTECEHIWVDRQSVDGVARSCSKCGKFYGFVRGATEAT